MEDRFCPYNAVLSTLDVAEVHAGSDAIAHQLFQLLDLQEPPLLFGRPQPLPIDADLEYVPGLKPSSIRAGFGGRIQRERPFNHRPQWVVVDPLFQIPTRAVIDLTATS